MCKKLLSICPRTHCYLPLNFVQDEVNNNHLADSDDETHLSQSPEASQHTKKRRSDASLKPIDRLEFAQNEDEMPPKSSKKKAKEASKKAKELASQLELEKLQHALLQAQNDPNKRNSPTEQVKIAAATKISSTKKKRKSVSTVAIEEENQLGYTKSTIVKTIQRCTFSTIKYVKGDGTQDKLASYVLFYSGMLGMNTAERKAWKEQFSGMCVTELNSHRSSVMTAIKREFKIKWKSGTPGDIGTVERWEACLSRDLNMDFDDDKADYSFYYDVIMDKATGYPDRWNSAHRGYMTLYKGQPPKGTFRVAKGDEEAALYVTPQTEAYALLIIKGNLEKWKAQFEVSQKFPGWTHKTLHKTVTDAAVIAASNAIKERLYRQQHGIDPLNDCPDNWLATMQLPFELRLGSEDKVRI